MSQTEFVTIEGLIFEYDGTGSEFMIRHNQTKSASMLGGWYLATSPAEIKEFTDWKIRQTINPAPKHKIKIEGFN